MTFPSNFIFTLAIFALALLPSPARADETSAAFLATWRDARDEPKPAAWEAFAAKYPKHDLARAAKILAAADHLRKNDAAKAIAAAAPLAGAEKGYAAAARGVLARARMIALAAQLKAYYKKHVEYPESLQQLVETKIATQADVTDPFGQAWGYLPAARATMPDLPRQTFTITCTSLGNARNTDLAKALDDARGAPLKRFRLNTTDPKAGNARITVNRPDGAAGSSATYPVGQDVGDTLLVGVYDDYVVLLWKEFPMVMTKE